MVKRNLMIDLDGVCADFIKHYYNLFNKSFESTFIGTAWKNINSVEDWWETIPPMDNFQEFWERMSKHNPTILTGCPPSGYDKAVNGKIAWCKKHIGEDVKVITCKSKDKQTYLQNKNDILIDDTIKICERWTDAGGLSLLYAPQRMNIIANLVDDLFEYDESLKEAEDE